MATLPGFGFSPGAIFCVARNYRNHAKELGNPIPKEPVYFMKPPGSLIVENHIIKLPIESAQVHFECELVVVIGGLLHRGSAESAVGAIAGFALGVDVTARDLQQKAKQSGEPWFLSKGFDSFAQVGAYVSKNLVQNDSLLDFEFFQNGSIRQRGRVSDMVFSYAELLSRLSHITRLSPGDLVFTGTPEGVGPLASGDQLECRFCNLGVSFSIRVA